MKKLIVVLVLLLAVNFVYAETRIVGTLTDVINPYTMTVDSGKIYIVEGHNIYIYSAKNLKLEKKFGKKGEGPGEFKVSPTTNMGCVQIIPDPKFITVISIGRLSYFTKAGEYVKEINTSSYWGGPKALGKNYIGRGMATEKGLRFNTIKIYDSNRENAREIIRTQGFYSEGRAVNPLYMAGPAYYVVDDKAYIEKDKDSIYVFDKDGKKISRLDINQGYKKVKLTSKDRTKFLEYFKTSPSFKKIYPIIKRDIQFLDYFPGIKYFYIFDKKIYILRWTKDTLKQEIAVFDLNGKLLKNTVAPCHMKDLIGFYPFTISDGKFYQLVENEEKEGHWDMLVTEL